MNTASWMRAQAKTTEHAAAHAKLQTEHQASTAELEAMQQRVGELDRQREEIQAASDQKIAELTQLLEVPLEPSRAPCACGRHVKCQLRAMPRPSPGLGLSLQQ